MSLASHGSVYQTRAKVIFWQRRHPAQHTACLLSYSPGDSTRREVSPSVHLGPHFGVI